MDKNIELALDNISLIKAVIERTQQDFAKISMFFVGIGIINAIAWVVEQIAYFIRNTSGYGNSFVQVLSQGSQIIKLAGYIFLFLYFYKKTQEAKNDICQGMVKIWGGVLVSSFLLTYFYMFLIPSGNNDSIITLWKCREIIEILPIILALFMTGVLTQKRIITICTAIYSIIYFVLFFTMKQVNYGTWGGAGTQVSLSSVTIRLVMIFGMIALGVYLKIGARSYGDKHNTRSISDEA